MRYLALILIPMVALAATPPHWRLVEQVERGTLRISQTPLNDIYYDSVTKCIKDGASDKYTVKPSGPQLWEPITHIITCVQYQQGEDTPIKTP